MILPTKHVPLEASLLAIGARLLIALESPRQLSDLWEGSRHRDGINSFDRFCTALTLLYVLDLVELDHSGTVVARRLR